MITCLILLCVPIFSWLGFVLYEYNQGRSINRENVMFLSLSCMFVIAGCGIAYYTNIADKEVRSGQVSGKTRETVSCSHSYSCRCRQVCSGSGKDRSCSEQCDTCYEHSHDYDWVIHTNIPSKHEIDRVDRQGVVEPPRFHQIKLNESWSAPFNTINYIKGSANTLFHAQGNVEIEKQVPQYPQNVRDYQYIDRVFGIGYTINPKWQRMWQDMNGRIGPSKHANAILVMTTMSADIDGAIETKWIGGKKNDVIVVMHVKDDNIESVKIISWTPNNLFKVELKDNLLGLETFDMSQVTNQVESSIMKNFQRQHMEEYSYLQADIDISIEWMIGITIVSLIGFWGPVLYQLRTVNKYSRRSFY